MLLTHLWFYDRSVLDDEDLFVKFVIVPRLLFAERVVLFLYTTNQRFHTLLTPVTSRVVGSALSNIWS